jgi:hypothetical protein
MSPLTEALTLSAERVGADRPVGRPNQSVADDKARHESGAGGGAVVVGPIRDELGEHVGRVAIGSLKLQIGGADGVQLGVVALGLDLGFVGHGGDDLVRALPIARNQQNVAGVVGKVDVHQVLGAGGGVDVTLIVSLTPLHVAVARI